MSKRVSALRRVLPLSIAAILLVAAAPQLPAAEIAVGVGTAGHGYHFAGLRVGIGLGYHGHHHGHWGYWGHYYPYRYHYRPYPYVYYHHRGHYGYPYLASGYFGALDLNVKPKRTTQVYIDGNYVGVAANFDGWPEYLWLEPGSYELIFYNPGYRTVVRQVEVRPGITLDIREAMQPGESIAVEDLTRNKPAERPAPSREARKAPPPQRAPAPAPAPSRPAQPGVMDAREKPARMQLQVAPADASVYLDGRFLGIAGEIGEQRGGILIDPGEHTLEIVRPGYSNRKLTFDAEPGKEVELEVELDSSAAKAGLSV